MPRILSVLAILCAFLAIACGGGDDGGASGVGAGSGALATATATVTVDSSNVKATTAPTAETSQVSVANEPVSVETPDGVVLQAHLYSPDGPKRQALVIVASVDQSVWAESTPAFTSQGVAVLTFDPRGYGETGGNPAPDALAADTELVTRFVMSREYPLVYLMGVGQDASSAVTEAAGSIAELSGVVTYGAPGKPDVANGLSLGGDATWGGENVLAIPDVQSRVLAFVLGGD